MKNVLGAQHTSKLNVWLGVDSVAGSEAVGLMVGLKLRVRFWTPDFSSAAELRERVRMSVLHSKTLGLVRSLLLAANGVTVYKKDKQRNQGGTKTNRKWVSKKERGKTQRNSNSKWNINMKEKLSSTRRLKHWKTLKTLPITRRSHTHTHTCTHKDSMFWKDEYMCKYLGKNCTVHCMLTVPHTWTVFLQVHLFFETSLSCDHVQSQSFRLQKRRMAGWRCAQRCSHRKDPCTNFSTFYNKGIWEWDKQAKRERGREKERKRERKRKV